MPKHWGPLLYSSPGFSDNAYTPKVVRAVHRYPCAEKDWLTLSVYIRVWQGEVIQYYPGTFEQHD